MMKPHTFIVLACVLPLSACDDAGDMRSNDRSGAPRGTFSSGANNMSAGGAPERGELEKLRLDNRSQRPAPPPIPSGGAPATSPSGSATAGDRDLQTDTLTGRPSTP
jgi:hypothetical protein